MIKNQQAIVVVGASAGSMQPMINLVKGLDVECNASIFIVQHIPAHAESKLSKVLQPHCRLPVIEPANHQDIEIGKVYTAKADHHLLLEDGKVLVTKGPRENHWRPSVDALFRSAAYAYRKRVIGIILSGALNDGSSGLWRIKQFDGIAIIQSRDEAAFDSMPASAARYVDIDYEAESNQLGKLINKISMDMANRKPLEAKITDEAFTKFEIDVAKGGNSLAGGVLDFGTFSPLTCPECHGALTEYHEGKLKRYRCHTGHGHTAESLLAGIDTNIEKSIWEVMRGMEEGQLLLSQMADELEKSAIDPATVTAYRSRADELAQRSQAIKSLVLSREAI